MTEHKFQKESSLAPFVSSVVSSSCFCVLSISLCVARKGYLEAAVPVFVSGMGGPGAAHEFRFDCRQTLGAWPCKRFKSFLNKEGHRGEKNGLDLGKV